MTRKLIETFEDSQKWSRPTEYVPYAGVVMNPSAFKTLKNYLELNPDEVIYINGGYGPAHKAIETTLNVDDAEALALDLLNQVQYIRRVQSGEAVR